MRRPDGKDGWIWNLSDTKRVLYRLPNLRGRETVYIVEGEKDADRLWKEGLPATCNVFGAGKWKEEFTRQLLDAGVRAVVILPDNDPAGMEHAHHVARECIEAKLETRIIRLPLDTKGSDASDYFDKENTVSDLNNLIDETPLLLIPPKLPAKENPSEKDKIERKEKARQGRKLLLSEPEPWPDPVDGANMLDECCAALRKYLTLPDGAAEALSLWAVFTHVIDAFQIAPRLALTSPEKRCGKTTTLSILSRLVHRPLPASSITAPAMFRTIESAQPTLLVDEADTFLHDNPELKGILNSGHYRTAAFVVRTVGEDHEPRRFSTWAAVAIAKIGNLPDTLQDRSIVIPMRRRVKTERVEPLRMDRTPDLDEIARKITR